MKDMYEFKNVSTQGDLTQFFPTCQNPISNLNFHIKTDQGLSHFMQKSIKFAISLYTPHKEIRAKTFPFLHAGGPRVVMGVRL